MAVHVTNISKTKLLIFIYFGFIIKCNGNLQFNCPKICYCSFGNTDSTYDYMSVNCSGKGISNIPPDMDPDTESIDFSNNKFTYIPSDINQFTSLLFLSFAKNELHYINRRTLEELIDLRTLDLSGNLFPNWTSIRPGDFLVHLKNLNELRLSRNTFHDISFADSTRLITNSVRILKLNKCRIYNIFNNAVFENMTQLIDLNLDDNYFTQFTGISSQSLKKLSLRRCRMRSIAIEAFLKLPSLEILDISENQNLKLYPRNKIYIQSQPLKEIILTDCNIIPSELAGFPNLTHIYMKGNLIRELPDNSFSNNAYLLYIDLSRTGLSKISKWAFKNLKYLKEIHLSENTLLQLHWDTFSSNQNLYKLNLSRNHFQHLTNFSNKYLKVLDLSICEIEHVNQNSLSGLYSIETLSLSHNILEMIPDHFESLTLQTLDLSYCRLTHFNNDTFSNLTDLKKLNLIGNRLTEGLKPYMFSPTIEEILLYDNPWRCDCQSSEFRRFYDYLKIPPPKISNEHRLICHSPIHLNGRSWLTACMDIWYPQSHITSPNKWMVIITIMIVMLFVFCIIMIVRGVAREHRRTQREEEERMRREEAEERIRVLRSYSDNPLPNAPDPRSEQSPPSYEEALQMEQRRQETQEQETQEQRSRRKGKTRKPKKNVQIRAEETNNVGNEIAIEETKLDETINGVQSSSTTQNNRVGNTRDLEHVDEDSSSSEIREHRQ